jgi:hypothetical protein
MHARTLLLNRRPKESDDPGERSLYVLDGDVRNSLRSDAARHDDRRGTGFGQLAKQFCLIQKGDLARPRVAQRVGAGHHQLAVAAEFPVEQPCKFT